MTSKKIHSLFKLLSKFQDLVALVDVARGAADRACFSIDDAMAFIDASNKRIASIEALAIDQKKDA